MHQITLNRPIFDDSSHIHTQQMPTNARISSVSSADKNDRHIQLARCCVLAVISLMFRDIDIKFDEIVTPSDPYHDRLTVPIIVLWL